MNDIYKLYDEVAQMGGLSPEYYDKMVHKVPDAPVFDRSEYLLKACRGKVILDVGASGPMSFALQDAAKEYHAVGIDGNPGLTNYHRIDLDNYDKYTFPVIEGLDLIIAGEILEHLSNPGRLLNRLRAFGVQVIVTVPNAFSTSGIKQMAKGIELVNKEHVSWYSYHTLKTLVERHRFNILLWAWYNGKPLLAEGLIFHLEPEHGNNKEKPIS